MKRFLFGACIALVMLSLSASESSARIIFGPYELGMSGTFGGCFGSGGMCRKDIIWASQTQLESHENGTLTMTFNINNFNPDNQNFYAGRATFELNQDYSLPPEECIGLGLDPDAQLKKGSYPIVWEGDVLKITFNTTNGPPAGE